MPPTPTQAQDFEILHATLRPRVLAFLHRFVTTAEAEDLAQEVFLRVHQGLPGFREESKVSTWVFQIATHLALDWIRSAPHRQALRNLSREEADIDPPAHPDPGQVPIQEEMCLCIRDMVSTLPLPYRTIVCLSELRDLDIREIAAILGLTPGAAKIRLHRARQRLRQHMEEGCRFLVDDRGELQCDPKGVSREGSAPSQVVKGEHHVHDHRNHPLGQDPGGLRPLRDVRDPGDREAHRRHGLRRRVPPG